VVFLGVSAAVFLVLPGLTPRLINHYANRTAAFRTKWVLFILFGLGTLALWAWSEAVLPAYIAGMVLSTALGADQMFIRRLRTVTIGFFSPLYFLRAGSFVSVPALVVAPAPFAVLLLAKVATKVLGLFPIIGLFRNRSDERWYYTLLMSTGLTFGTISALFGLSHRIITSEQYSYLVAVVIGSAVVPTLIANAFFLPRHLLPSARSDVVEAGRPASPLESPEPFEEG